MHELFVRVITAAITVSVFLGIYVFSAHLFTLVIIAILLEILFFEWPRIAAKNKTMWLLIPFYPTLSFLGLIYLNYHYRMIDILLPLYPLFICWAADTGGYLFGNLAGRHKICPDLSPKKSWEGLLGSFLFVIAINYFLFTQRSFFSILHIPNHMLSLTLFSLSLTLLALAGDLFESLLKRKAKIKDSGSILPGHGGLLDRFDSTFFVVLLVLGLLG